MTKITYITGDALEPIDSGNKIICHVCNNRGAWGSGFVVAISKKWSLPEKSYRSWYYSGDSHINSKDYPPFQLGNVQLVEVEDHTYIANMIAQHDTRFYEDIPPIRYDRLRQCLNKVALMADKHEASVHMPRIGCGLAGGTWQVVEGLIKETLIAKGIEVTVYTLENDKSWK